MLKATHGIVVIMALLGSGIASNVSADSNISQIDISWKCVSRQMDSRYPCKNHHQTIRFFGDGRALLQDKGELCANESRNNRMTYDAFVNRSASGKFICAQRDFDFEVSYSSNVTLTPRRFEYRLKGSLSQKLRANEVDTGQRLTFNTTVYVTIGQGGCDASLTQRFSERFGSIPRISNATYKYVSTSCKAK